MPMYEYICANCKHKFDVLKSIKNIENLEKCPICGSNNTERKISPSYVKFKGPGWETNDNYYGKAPHKDMDPSKGPGSGIIENPTNYDKILHKKDLNKKNSKKKRRNK